MYGTIPSTPTSLVVEKDSKAKVLNSVKTNYNLVQFSNLPIFIGFVLSVCAVGLLLSVKESESALQGYKYVGSMLDTLLNSNSHSDFLRSASPNFQDTKLEFSFARDGYGALDLHHDFLTYKFLENYDGVIEPYAKMNLIVTSNYEGSYFKYTVCNSGSTSVCSVGLLSTDSTQSQPVQMSCTPFDELSLTIVQYSSTTDEVMSTSTGSLMCLYVRREIRSLTVDDRDAMLDAMHTMWVVSETDGQMIYGEDYHDASYLLNFHHFNAAWQDSDHIHEGNGFLLQHLKITNIFEKAMQAVDPSVTLAYWDFTVESASDTPVNESPIMTADYFGSMTLPTNPRYGFTYADDSVLAAAIPDGRWAYIKAQLNDKFPSLKAGYGYMRAPWNMNPSPYVSRFTAVMQIGTMLPTCASHYEMLQETDLMDFFNDFQTDPHATTHSMIGGTYGCDLMVPLLDAGYINDEDSLLSICSNWIFYMKEFYRANYVLPKSNCDASEPDKAVCGFSCIAGTEVDLLFNLKNKLGDSVPKDMTDDGWNAWVDFICTGDGQRIFSGDHLESASPSDPSFWPIHTTLERLTHAKIMAGGFETTDWAKDSQNDYVCAKASCYEGQYGTTDYWSDCCIGHYQFDQLLDAVKGEKSAYYGPTNDETFLAIDPTSEDYSMPYIYDSFTWTHCEEDFPDLLSSLYQKSLLRRKV